MIYQLIPTRFEDDTLKYEKHIAQPVENSK